MTREAKEPRARGDTPGSATAAMDADLRRLLGRLARAAVRLVWASSAAVVVRTSRELEIVAAAGKKVLRAGTRLPLERTAAGRVIVTGRGAASADTATDPRALMRSPCVMPGARAIVLVPLRVNGAVVGALGVGRDSPGPFGEDERLAIDQIALAAGLAMENAVLRTAGAVPCRCSELRGLGVSLTSSPPEGMLLSPRQSQVAEQLLLGRTSREVADELRLSVRTVHHVIEALKERFGQSRLHGLTARLARSELVRGPR